MKLPLVALASVTMFAAASYAFVPTVRTSVISRSFGLVVRSSQSTTTTTTSLNMVVTPADFVQQEISNNNVVVFSKSYCPFCTASKGLLQDMGIDYKAIELDEIPNGDAIQAALLEQSGQRTVPNVFVKGQHVGGNDDTQAAAKSGKLQEMLN